MQKEENQKLDSKQIDIQPHAKVRSRRARQLAEERAKTRFAKRILITIILFIAIPEFGNVMWLNKKKLKNKPKR
jgi:hypothetical protein